MIIAKPAPLLSTAVAGWQPARLQLDTAIRADEDPSVTVVSTIRLPFGASTTPPELVINAWRGSTLLGRDSYPGRSSQQERAAAAGVRDALLASDFLRRSSVVTSTPAIPLNHVRLTVTDASGTRRAITFPVGSEVLPRVNQAFERYVAVAFPELAGA